MSKRVCRGASGVAILAGLVTAGLLLGLGGYLLGFYPSVENRMDEGSCRTVAFEVGMQNGGMTTGIAVDVLNSHVAALPPNVFGTWMNISGSMLANWWKRKPVPESKRVQAHEQTRDEQEISPLAP